MLEIYFSVGLRGWIAGATLVALCASCSEPDEEETSQQASPTPVESDNAVELATIPSRSAILDRAIAELYCELKYLKFTCIKYAISF